MPDCSSNARAQEAEKRRSEAEDINKTVMDEEKQQGKANCASPGHWTTNTASYIFHTVKLWTLIIAFRRCAQLINGKNCSKCDG